MNAVTLVFGLAAIFTTLSVILFWRKIYKKGNIGKVFTIISTCIAVFFLYGACGIIPAKEQIASYHNEVMDELYRECKKNPNIKSLEDLDNRQISEYVYVDDFTVSKDGGSDIIKAKYKIDLVYGLYITSSDKVDLASVQVWDYVRLTLS